METLDTFIYHLPRRPRCRVSDCTSREPPMVTSTIPLGPNSFTVGDVMLVAPNAVNVNTKRGCPLCGHEVKQRQLWGHVGRHILFRSRGMNERLPREVDVLATQCRFLRSLVCQINVDPRGFCCASGCTTRLVFAKKHSRRTAGNSKNKQRRCYVYSSISVV